MKTEYFLVWFRFDGKWQTMRTSLSNNAIESLIQSDCNVAGVIRFRQMEEDGVYVNWLQFRTRRVKRRWGECTGAAVSHCDVKRLTRSWLDAIGAQKIEALTWMREPKIDGWLFERRYEWAIRVMYPILWAIELVRCCFGKEFRKEMLDMAVLRGSRLAAIKNGEINGRRR